MRRIALAFIGLSAAMLVGPGAARATTVHHRVAAKHRHTHSAAKDAPVQAAAGGRTEGVPPVTPGSIGSYYGGLGSQYDNSAFGYDGELGGPRRAGAQIGSALVGGGATGDAYVDYVKHYYYYKYDYCRLGSAYVWYLRRCVSPLDLFQ